MFDSEDYKNTMPYPDLPRKPKAPQFYTLRPNAAEIAEYNAALDQHKLDMEKYCRDKEDYNEAIKAIRAKSEELDQKFWSDLIEDCGVDPNHPLLPIIRAKAWEDGHSGGYGEVESEFRGLVSDFINVEKVVSIGFNSNDAKREFQKWWDDKGSSIFACDYDGILNVRKAKQLQYEKEAKERAERYREIAKEKRKSRKKLCAGE